jgi:hypothetical protein
MKKAIERFEHVLQYLLDRSFILILIIIVINLVTKILFLDRESLWLDEASTLNWALHSFSEILRTSLEDPNGPVYQLLLKVWVGMFGISEFAGRLISAIIGSLIVWPLFLLAKEIFDKKVALVAIILATFSNELLFWSHEVRSYTLVVFLAVWSFYFFHRIIKNGKIQDVIWYWLISSVLVFTHLTATMVIVAQFFASFLFIRDKLKHVIFLYAGMALVTTVFGLWLFNNSWIGGGETVWAPVPNFQSIVKLLATYFNSERVLYLVGVVLVVFVVALVAFKTRLGNKKMFFTVLIWGLVPIVITYLGSIYYNPRFLTKYMLYVVPGLYLTVAVILTHTFTNKNLTFFWSVFFILLMAWFFNLNPDKSEKWRHALSFHNKYYNEHTFTIINAPYQALSFSYYYDIEIFKDYENREELLLKDRIIPTCSLDKVKGLIEADTSATQMILILSHEGMCDPNNEMLNYMKAKYYLKSSATQLHGIRAFVFDLNDVPHESEPDYYIDSVPIKKTTYGEFFVKKIADFSNPSFSTIKVSCVIQSNVNLEGSHVVFSTRGKNKRNVWDSYSLSAVEPGKEHYYEKTFFIPDDLVEGSDIAIYIWQPNSKRELIVKEIKVWID